MIKPITLVPHYRLRRATAKEIEEIRAFYPQLQKQFSIERDFYEVHWAYKPDDGGVIGNYPTPERWRYHVVEFFDTGAKVQDLQRLLSILEPEITLGAMFSDIPGGLSRSYRELAEHMPKEINYWHALLDEMINPPRPWNGYALAVQDIGKIAPLFNAYMEAVTRFPNVIRVIYTFYYLYAIPRNRELYGLGLFTVLEALITHRPGDRDIGDSISHQIQTKMSLLSKRLDAEVDFSCFQSGATEKKLWSALYSYRSALAHGDSLDFTAKPLSILKDQKTVTGFMRRTVKALLRGALVEPQLYQDLKGC